MINKMISLILIVPFLALLISGYYKTLKYTDDDVRDIFMGACIWLYLIELFGFGLYFLFK